MNNEKIEQFIQELKNSDYNQKQARDIVNCGIKVWKKEMERRKRDGIPFYRLAEETIGEINGCRVADFNNVLLCSPTGIDSFKITLGEGEERN